MSIQQKFIYSEKASKFCKISTVDLTGTTLGQIYGGDFTKFCGLLRIYELYISIFELRKISTQAPCRNTKKQIQIKENFLEKKIVDL